MKTTEKMRLAARDYPCMNCGADNETIVAAHRNEGKGVGQKVDDCLVAYLCYDCHSELDNGNSLSKPERREFWNQAFIKTIHALIRDGVLK